MTLTIAQIALRNVLEDRGWKTGSSLENSVARHLSRFGFKPENVAQEFSIGRFQLTFAWPEIKVALEADGWHHRSPEGASKDAERDSWLRSEGWIVFRVDDRHGDDSFAEQLVRVSRLIRMMEANR